MSSLPLRRRVRNEGNPHTPIECGSDHVLPPSAPLGLQGLPFVGLIVSTDMGQEMAIPGFNRMQFVIFARVWFSRSGRDGGQPTPGLAVIERFADANPTFL